MNHMHALGGCHIFWICHKNRITRMHLVEGHARMHVPGGGTTYNRVHIFMLLCIHIYMPTSIDFYNTLSVHGSPSILYVYDIYIHILRKHLLILCVISLSNPLCISGSYHLCHMYKIFTTHIYTME
jgi:hypothetical protein